jgi:hypothetical protein
MIESEDSILTLQIPVLLNLHQAKLPKQNLCHLRIIVKRKRQTGHQNLSQKMVENGRNSLER